MTGLLLLNVGTPDSPSVPAVRTYLREFLSDPRVLDMNPVGRALLVNCVILPFRPVRSAAAYRKIWSDRGSPLVFHGEDLRDKMAAALGDSWQIELAMRYGRPSIAKALERFRSAGCDRLVVFPLYPQYSAAATGSSIEEVFRQIGERWHVPSLAVVPPFFGHPAFIRALVTIGRPILDQVKPDHVLLSYHGLPERHCQKSDDTGCHCLVQPDCCEALVHANRNCYRAQCLATSRALVNALGLAPDSYTTSFQSRLGRTPWIKPYTDAALAELARRGTKRVVVFCPAFVADCLETLEEIGMRAAESFQEAGGEKLCLVPSLNAHPAWVEAACVLVRDTTAWAPSYLP